MLSTGLDVADLKLLHFWVLNTALTCGPDAHLHLFQNAFVELGFRHHFLLHGILAMAALHKASIYPAECEELSLQSSTHMDIAIHALRTQLRRPDPATCSSIFALAILVVVHSLGIAQLHPPTDPIGDICHWMRLIKGVQATVEQNWARLLTSEVSPIIMDVERDRTQVSTGNIAPVLGLKDLITQTMPSDSPHQATYLQAIDELHIVHLNVQHHRRTGEKVSVQITLTWTATIDPILLDLLEERDHLALLILAYFAVLFEWQGDSWWMRGWATWTLDAVQMCLGEEYSQWMEWPLKQLQGS